MNWSKYTAEYVRTTSVNGRRLVLDFAKDFKDKFNYEICISCISNFNTDFNKYINKTTQKMDSKYKLKLKYNNIPLGFGKKGRLSNEKMNDEDALFLLNNHPKGAELFDKIPEPIKETAPTKVRKTKAKKVNL